MDTPPVTLGADEQCRLYVLTELLAGRLTTIEAALALDGSIVLTDLPDPNVSGPISHRPASPIEPHE